MVGIENGKLQTPDSFLKHTEMSLKSRTRGLVVNDLCIPHFRSVLTGELFGLFYGRFCVCVWPVQCVGRSRCARPAQRPRRAAPRATAGSDGSEGFGGSEGCEGSEGSPGPECFGGSEGSPGSEASEASEGSPVSEGARNLAGASPCRTCAGLPVSASLSG